ANYGANRTVPSTPEFATFGYLVFYVQYSSFRDIQKGVI
ncbi:MAG: hypothetical protein ACI9GB_003319, partial [Halioglobus sp.]